jgi:hypothetical protein
MPIPISGISPSARASPMVRNPTSVSSAISPPPVDGRR